MWTPCRRPKSARTDAGVAALPAPTTTRTMLFLSRNETLVPVPCCAHPSGYFTEYPATGFRNTRNTWLSGMSPAAVAFASACNAAGLFAVIVAVLTAAVAVVVVTVAGGVARRLDEPPQPAARATNSTAGIDQTLVTLRVLRSDLTSA